MTWSPEPRLWKHYAAHKGKVASYRSKWAGILEVSG
jgi:hypothetical protein